MSEQSHVCVLQTALDLLQLGYDVHVLADGVSSSRPQEVPIALARMRQAGAQITTSETVAFELQGLSMFGLSVTATHLTSSLPMYPLCS